MENHDNFRALAENANDGILVATGQGKHVYANKRAAEITGFRVHELLEAKMQDLAHPDELKKLKERLRGRLERKPVPRRYETAVLRKDGKKVPVEVTGAKTSWHGQPADIVIIRDITERKRREEELEALIKERTAALRQREKELEAKTIALKETNTALNILLKKRARDKNELEEKVLSNVKELIEPYLKKLKKAPLDPKNETYLTILTDNLKEILSPFSRRLSDRYASLTPKEAQVADLIRHGKNTRQIAELLDSSIWTIQFHRKNLRIKLGLRNRKDSLKYHLLTFTE